MIGFLDLQFVTRRRRAIEARRARRIFALSVPLTLICGAVAYLCATTSRPWLAVLAMFVALWFFALNCAALSKLRDLAAEERGRD